MKKDYNLNYKLVACILVFSLFLQSCGNPFNQLAPKVKTSSSSTTIQRLTHSINIDLLKDQELTSERGYLISFHEGDNGMMQADVKVDETQKHANYRNLPVAIEKGADLSELSKLNPKIQQQRIQLDRSQAGQPTRILIFKGGLAGGMMDDNNGNRQEEEDNLHRAAQSGDLKKVKRLLKNESNINIPDQNGWTPLHYAIVSTTDEGTIIKIINKLLNKQADINAVDNDGKTPLDYAREYKRHDVVALLEKKEWEKFQVNYDDSSDEEDIASELEKYKLFNSTQEFRDQLSDSCSTQKYIISFITHAIGLQIFYSKEVAEKYYPLKGKHLKQQTSSDFRERLQSKIDGAIQNIMHKLFLDSSLNADLNVSNINKFYSDIVKVLVEGFKKKDEEFIDELQNLIFYKIRYILKFENLPEIQNKFLELKDKVQQYITFLTENNFLKIQELISNEKLKLPEHKNLPTFNIELENTPILKTGLEKTRNETKEKIKRILNKNVCIARNNKMKRIKPFFLNSQTSQFERKILKIVRDKLLPNANANPTVDNFISNHYESNILEWTFLLFKYAIKDEKKREDSIIIEKDNLNYIKEDADFTQSNLKDYKDILHEFIPLTLKRIGEIINENINKIDTTRYEKMMQDYTRELRELLNQEGRRTLPNLYEFDFQNEYDILGFIANLRLCNRSITRVIRNDMPFNNRLLSDRKQQRGCKFPASTESALEIQEVTNGNNRKDLVINSGSYRKIYYTIQKILTQYRKIKDKDIAFWIRQTLEGEKLEELTDNTGKKIEGIDFFGLKEIKRTIVNITYLLFGTEVVRNPASLVHHNMMLDLINDCDYKWEMFLIGDAKNAPLLPMQIKKDKKDIITHERPDNNGAVRCARTLHNEYKDLMPYKYVYHGDLLTMNYCKVQELVSREEYLTYLWLQDFVEPSRRKSGDPIKKTIDIIYEECQRWFKINIETIQSEQQRPAGAFVQKLTVLHH